jgi:regulator of protease activity HflC (stomatin/prohibitin superfamily)
MRIMSSMLLIVVLVGSGLTGCAKVDSGHGGVLWTAWSGTQTETYPEGWHFVAPWNKMYSYDIRTQDRLEDLHVLANNGLSIKLETSVRYKAKAEALFSLQTTIGPDYYDVILAPAILVRNVDLPPKLKTAINEKLEEEQRALKMKFTLDKERQEAERKKIEANGVAERNRIITESISDNLLRYKGIEVTELISTSNNAKVIIIGSGKDGLPIISS